MHAMNRRQALGALGALGAGAMALGSTGTAFAKPPDHRGQGTLAPLNWPRPQLTDPQTIVLGTGFTDTQLDDNTDYIIQLPLTTKNGATILRGGNKVVIVGGHIRLPTYTGDSAHARALFITGNTGVVHIEGVLIDTSAQGQGDALAIQAQDAIVQVQACRFVNILGASDQFHGDVIQPWGGVKELRVDQFTASSSYQGFFLAESEAPIGRVIVKRTNVTANPEWVTGAKGGYMWWMGTGPSIQLSDVWVQPRAGRLLENSVWPDVSSATNPVSIVNGTATWPTMANVTGGIHGGRPAGGDFCPAGVAGLAYPRL